MIVMPDTFTAVYRKTIVSLADRHRLPTIYPFRIFAPGRRLAVLRD